VIHTTDEEIRSAFHKKKLRKYHECPNTLVIDELGLAHGKHRVDIAVLNGFIHGYEIKSSKDTLSRLPSQFNEYKRSLEKVSIISAPNHMDELIDTAPGWCGLILADKGPRGGIHFSNIRNAKMNPEVESVFLAHLLWKKEVLDLLTDLGTEKELLSGPKISLYRQLSEIISIRDLSKKIKELFMGRENWRVESPLFQDDDLLQPASR
jgi:hypothetical protein